VPYDTLLLNTIADGGKTVDEIFQMSKTAIENKYSAFALDGINRAISNPVPSLANQSVYIYSSGVGDADFPPRGQEAQLSLYQDYKRRILTDNTMVDGKAWSVHRANAVIDDSGTIKINPTYKSTLDWVKLTSDQMRLMEALIAAQIA